MLVDPSGADVALSSSGHARRSVRVRHRGRRSAQVLREGAGTSRTPQYLDEADELADSVVVVDRGEIIASGTPDQLKDQVGGDLVEFTVPDRTRLDDAVSAISGLSDTPPNVERETRRVRVAVGSRGSQALVEAVRRLDAVHVETADLALHRPSLDDVFLAVTGHAAESSPNNASKKRGSRNAGTGGTT